MAHKPDFDTIDAEIEVLHDRIESCRKAMTVSRAAIVASFVTLCIVMTIAEGWRTPMVVFSAIAGLMGGIVWLGASRTTHDEAREALASLDLTRSRMIDEVAARNGWRDLTPTVH